MANTTVKIVQKDNKILRKKALKVKKAEFGSKDLTKILDKMNRALQSQDDGVALAAPQIAVSKRIFVVSPRVDGSNKERRYIFINPEIIKRSRDRKLMEEGCLSIRWWYGKIRRSSRVTVKAYDENGVEFEIKSSGLLAQIFQHEIDHLDGTLFVDSAIELRELDPKDEK